jgi:signal transduction histidine kinase
VKRWTIRVRLTVLYGGLFFLAGAMLLGVTYLLVQQSLEARMTPDRAAFEFRPGRVLGDGESSTVRLADGREVNVADAIETIRRDQEHFRQETLHSLLTRGGIALVGVGTVAGAFGWLVAGRALQPLHRITETASRIAAADSAGRGLHERIALAGPGDEIKELADTFDSMLERLDRSFDGQRRFVASASHEMRTPLALNRALVELAVSRPGAPEETRRLGESLLAVNERHERLIDGLLTLADSENAVTERVRLDLADVAGHVLDLAAAEAAKRGVAVSSVRGPAVTTGDPILVERLTQNLVENAIRHNVAVNGWLSVRTSTVDARAVIEVSNSGPVVPPYEVETLFQPFRRLQGERLGRGRGFGLGLSIVRSIAHAHGGEVAAVPRDGGGLVVTVTLPT